MLNKIRRKSRHDAIGGFQRHPVGASVSILPVRSLSDQRVTFFSLPAELRNVVYEIIARETRIRIPSATERSGKRLPPIPSLLIVSRQCRAEYMPLVLALARIRVVVKDYDFRRVAAVTRGLYSTELKALRENNYLRIELLVDKCSKDSLVALRRWLENRGRGLDRLPWSYGVTWKVQQQLLPTSAAVSAANAYVLRKKTLRQNVEALCQLHKGVGEMVQFELLSVIDALQEELSKMGSDSKRDQSERTVWHE